MYIKEVKFEYVEKKSLDYGRKKTWMNLVYIDILLP